MTPREFEAQMKALADLAESTAELKTMARSNALLMVVSELLAMLSGKGVLDDNDVKRMLAEMGLKSAAISATDPDTSKCLAEAVLYLQHGSVEKEGKAN